MTKVVIVVEGGIVQKVLANTNDIEITVLDWDSEDEDELDMLNEMEQKIVTDSTLIQVY
jgi:hypothetical protein